jgi:hypothetical protein
MVLFYRIFFRPDHRAFTHRMQGTSHPPRSMAGALANAPANAPANVLANALPDLLPDAMMQIGFCQPPESCYYPAAQAATGRSSSRRPDQICPKPAPEDRPHVHAD